ncbi:OB-fold domain-containing protein [Phenylobacterium sp. LjRoot219]|uniref:Zn-ribbon domain-containing OB-fold protein n=1 Tax=Phenylobacterium sp. LjRoot219 TaxID=3342283 RepID=UPI003ED10BA3
MAALSGRGVVVARTTNHQMWHPEFTPPYVIAIVELEEASHVRLTTRIVNCMPEDVVIGSRVRVVFERQGPAWMPLFELDAA